MKKLAVFIFICLVSQSMFAQDYIPTKDDIARFKTTKTYVVLEDNILSEYNLILKEVMPQEWKVTPYDFISWKEFESKRMDPGFSFIILSQVSFTKDNLKTRYNFMSLVLGGSGYSLNNMPDLCSLPLSYVGAGDIEYSYKLGIFLRFMQNHVKLLEERPGLASENIFKHYNENISDLKDKTLYLVADDMSEDVNTLAKIKKVYAGKVKLVTPDDIQKTIADREDVILLHKVGPAGTREKARCYKILIGAADANFYYFDYHMITDKVPDGFQASDFKKLAKKTK
jgi:hypothetical protein